MCPSFGNALSIRVMCIDHVSFFVEIICLVCLLPLSLSSALVYDIAVGCECGLERNNVNFEQRYHFSQCASTLSRIILME